MGLVTVGNVEAFTNADYAGYIRTRSMSGVVAAHEGCAIASSSQLQWSLALSKREREFIAASDRARELLWLKCLLEERNGKYTSS
jgi:hypothetical protein